MFKVILLHFSLCVFFVFSLKDKYDKFERQSNIEDNTLKQRLKLRIERDGADDVDANNTDTNSANDDNKDADKADNGNSVANDADDGDEDNDEDSETEALETGFDLDEQEMEKFAIWPEGYIPYYIDVTSFSDKVVRDKIRSYLNLVNSITPLNFVELPSPPEDNASRWVFFINRKGLFGCAEHTVWDFTNNGVQRVVLGFDCLNNEGELAEAVLALAGVPAQHTAPNRDDHVTVYEENILPDKAQLFEKLTDSDWLFHDLAYDYESAGHFHSFKFSANGKTVIEPKNPNIVLGESKDLSPTDVRKIKMLYGFITKKKELKVPECEKLFKVGKKFGLYKPNKDPLKAMKKPNKYTGLADNKKSSDEKNIEEEGKVNSEKDEGSTENKNKESALNDNKVDSKKADDKDNATDSPLKIQKLKFSFKSDPLTYLSDYGSQEEDHRKERITKIKHKTLKFTQFDKL